MLTAQVNEIIRLYPLGALAIPKCIHLQKLTDSKSKYKKVLRTHRKHFSRKTQEQPKQRLLFIIYMRHSNCIMSDILQRVYKSIGQKRKSAMVASSRKIYKNVIEFIFFFHFFYCHFLSSLYIVILFLLLL